MPRQPLRFRPIRLAALGLLVAVLAAAGVADYGTGGGYVVQPGDSLWAIATEHGTTVDELAAVNHLDPAAILPVGIVLTIPGTAPAPEASAPPGGSSCNDPSSGTGPPGVLPSLLAASPERLALRPYFEEWAYHYGVPPALVEAVAWQESGWQQGTVSATGAVGVGQIEPGTASFISNVLIGEPLDPSSASDNIRMSAAFLAYLYRLEGGSTCATLAAYYEGPLNLSEHGMFGDTEQYVADVEALVPRFE
jgi:murein DD-endopeptidase MepM/ murein hydrolase activator NlpD